MLAAIFLALLTLGNVFYAYILHILFRGVSGWSKYEGVSVVEVIFLYVSTFPLLLGAGYFAFPVPLIVGLPAGGEHFITLRKGDALESFLFHAIWLISTTILIWLVHRAWKKKGLCEKATNHA